MLQSKLQTEKDERTTRKLFLFVHFSPIFCTLDLVLLLALKFRNNFISGVILISLALCADAVIGNVQEKAMRAHKSSNTEVVSLSTFSSWLFYRTFFCGV